MTWRCSRPRVDWDGQEQRVSLCDGFVFRKLLDEEIRLGGIAAAENRSRVVAEEADLIVVLVAAPEIGRGRGRPPVQRCYGLTDTRGSRP